MRQFLNNQPSIGMSFKYGIPAVELLSVSLRMPPMTMVSPSFTSTFASASRLSSSNGTTGELVPAGTVGEFAIELDFTLIFIKKKPTPDTDGTTLRVLPNFI